MYVVFRQLSYHPLTCNTSWLSFTEKKYKCSQWLRDMEFDVLAKCSECCLQIRPHTYQGFYLIKPCLSRLLYRAQPHCNDNNNDNDVKRRHSIGWIASHRIRTRLFSQSRACIDKVFVLVLIRDFSFSTTDGPYYRGLYDWALKLVSTKNLLSTE